MSRHPSTIIRDAESDLDHYPALDRAHPASPDNQITIGDLHANALKLIYALIRQNVLNVSEDDYNLIRDIYKKATTVLTAEDLINFDAAISRITANPTAMVRLIGDELADRGSNDLWVLKLLERLNQLKVPTEILISNHGLGFIDGYQSGRFTTDHYNASAQNSMTMLKQLIDRNLIRKTEVDRLVNEQYQPLLKALSYSISKDGKGITLYSHAPIDFITIQNMAETLGIEYRAASLEELAQTIDIINEKFNSLVKTGKIFSLFPEVKKLTDMLVSYDEVAGLDRTRIAFEFLVWNRRIEKNTACFRTNSAFSRPAAQNGYQCQFVHGHDSEPSGLAHIINLDNSWGKEGARATEAKDYLVHYSQDFKSLLAWHEYQYQQALTDLVTSLNDSKLSLTRSLRNSAIEVLNSVIAAKKLIQAHELPLLIQVLSLTKQGLIAPLSLHQTQCQLLLKKLPGKENWAKLIAGSFTAFVAGVATTAALVALSVFIISALPVSGIVIPGLMLTAASSISLGGAIGLFVGAHSLAGVGMLVANNGKRSGSCKAFAQFWQETRLPRPAEVPVSNPLASAAAS